MTAADTTPAARMREAAEVVRKHAADATPGPWVAYERDCDMHVGGVPDGPHVALLGRESWPGVPADAAWIALMSPGVGEALAASLETAATYLGDEPQVTYPSHVVAALAVADAILARGVSR